MENVSSNAALMRRIVHLEKERDELQKDIETMCLEQAGVSGSIDISTRMQARRAAGLEQELDSCKEKTLLLTRENHNLQEELSEAYRLKSQLTEAFKRAVEKNNQLEKEVKFYQSKVATAFSERDKAIVEVERVHEAEKAMSANVQQLHSRMEEAERHIREQEAHKLEIQHGFDTKMDELDTLNKVVAKFWGMRESVLATPDGGQNTQPVDRAKDLLLESDAQWTYGGRNHEALKEALKEARALAEENGELAKAKDCRAIELDAQLAKLKEEINASTRSIQVQLEEKQHAEQMAAEKASTYEMHLGKLQKSTAKVLEAQADHDDVRTSVDSLLEGERRWIDSMVVYFEALLLELKTSEVHPEIVDKYEENRSPPQEEVPLPAGDASGSVGLEENSLPAAEPSGAVISEDNPLPAAEPSSAVDLDDNLLLTAETSRTVPSEENLAPGAEPSLPIELEESVFSETVPPRAIDVEEPQTSEDPVELDRTAFSQEENARVSVHTESSPGSDMSFMVSSVQPETAAGAQNDVSRISEDDACSAVVTLSRSASDMDEGGRKALAQALHEKVEALLLLSQQEERYYLESKTIQGLEFQIKDLNEKISQVTSEKVSALMEVAQLRNDCHRFEEREKELIRRLQLHRSTNAGGRLLPASWSEASVGQDKSHTASEKQIIVPKPITTSGYLKSWFRGLDMSAPVGLKVASEPTKPGVSTSGSKSTETEEPVDVANLRVENAALQERVAGVQSLTESAHRLRMTLLKVSNDSESEQSMESLHSALAIVDTVRRESNHLRIALGCSLPVSVTPESSPESEGSNLTSRKDVPNSGGGEVHSAVDVATSAGIEMVELLLAACEMQKGGLQRQIDFIAMQCKDSGVE